MQDLYGRHEFQTLPPYKYMLNFINSIFPLSGDSWFIQEADIKLEGSQLLNPKVITQHARKRKRLSYGFPTESEYNRVFDKRSQWTIVNYSGLPKIGWIRTRSPLCLLRSPLCLLSGRKTRPLWKSSTKSVIDPKIAERKCFPLGKRKVMDP